MDIAWINEVEQLTNCLETEFRNNGGAFSLNDAKSDSVENMKNPMLLSPVIRCILEFLNIREIKNCRLVCCEWGSTGKLALANRALIRFHKYEEHPRLPVNFYSCFLDSSTFFSAFKISGDLTKDDLTNSWTIEELAKLFEKHEKYIKDLTLNLGYSNENFVNTIDLSSWISKSPMVQKDAKYMTKLSISGLEKVLYTPLHLVLHIKDLTLANCRINVDAGTKICPVKLKLHQVTFFQNEIKMDNVRINDIVDFSKAKVVDFYCESFGTEQYILDLSGSETLDSLSLDGVEILNGEISRWVIEHMWMTEIPYYSLNNQMDIKNFTLMDARSLDLFELPNSIQKLSLHNVRRIPIRCSQPIVLANLKCLKVHYRLMGVLSDYSFLSHFMNCPQLKFLKLKSEHPGKEIYSLWMPRSVKTLTLERSLINWVGDSYLYLEKLVLYNCGTPTKELSTTKIRADHIFIYQLNMTVDKNLVLFLESRNRFYFRRTLCIGFLTWDKQPQNEDTVLKEHVDVKSSFYVFEYGKKGRAISEEVFLELLPELLYI